MQPVTPTPAREGFCTLSVSADEGRQGCALFSQLIRSVDRAGFRLIASTSERFPPRSELRISSSTSTLSRDVQHQREYPLRVQSHSECRY